MPELDDIDQRIIAALRRDSRISNADLAARVGLSPSSCWRRTRALEERGAIRRYTIDVDDAAIGMNFRAIVHVQLTRHDQALVQDFIRRVRTKDEVRACHATTGRSDYLLQVVCRDLDAYNRFLEDFLFAIPAVASAQTSLVLRSVKD